MCSGKCDCKSKKIPRKAYTETIKEFVAKKGLLCPVYADTVIEDINKLASYCDGSAVVNKVLNLMNRHESCSNKVVGYFASLPTGDKEGPKFMTAMSFCVPCDYPQFDRTFAKFSAMRKALAGNGMMAHCSKRQQVIFSQGTSSPIYYFTYGNEVSKQLEVFMSKCDKYYK